MAGSIDPFKKKVQAPPQVITPEKKEELLARATGAKRTLPTPPSAAKLPAGVTGNPPLPANKVVGHIAPSSLTDIERKSLEAVGWTDSIPLPTSHEGMKQLQSELAAMREVEVPLPVDPKTPPLKVNTVPIESLSAEKQAQIQNVFKNIGAQEAQKAAAAQQSKDFMSREASIKGIGSAHRAADQATEAFKAKLEATKPAPPPADEPVYEVNVAPEPKAAPAPAPEPAPMPHTHSDTGANAGLSHCPHCQWDLSIADIPEPPYADKVAFLQCMLGEKPFVKTYPLFNNNVQVTFRTLTTRELDVVSKQAYKDRQEGKLPNELDYWEQVNRYRLMLQLQGFHSASPGGFHKDLPDGYSKSTNPMCTGTWVNEEREGELGLNETGIPMIEQWIIEEVLKTEAVFRIVNNTCNQFNRLASRMEAMADNSDFWIPTEGQSS